LEKNIHPSSVIGKNVKIGKNVHIGPFCFIEGDVTIGDDCFFESHVTLGCAEADVIIGKGNTFHPGAVIGGRPQDLKYKNEKVKLVVGDYNVFRECVTVNLGTLSGIGETRIGSHGLFMAYVHIGHDCILGDHVVVANSTNFAGHVTAEDHVKIGGACNFNQFVKLGEHSYIAGLSGVNKDILPYTIARAPEGGLYAVSAVTNKVGLERSGYSPEEVASIHKAIRIFLKSQGTKEELIEKIKNEVELNKHVENLIHFINTSERGVAKL
jgi:UDP-N-acetylglucosamine acyltransferase